MGWRVLIVDDSPVSRRYIQRILNVSGFSIDEFLEAENGVAAIEALKTNAVDLVVTDVNMPEMNGDELVRWIDREHRSLPVVIVSTDSSLARVQRLTRVGPRGYVSKPFSPETLRAEIDRVLAAREVVDPFAELLATSAEKALETMFFTSLIQPPDCVSTIPPDCIWVRVPFACELPGCLQLGVEPRAARAFAANFMGIDFDEPSEEQVEQTVCELANVICGSLLSKLESQHGFQILPPELIRENPGPALESAANDVLRFHCEDGAVIASLSLAV